MLVTLFLGACTTNRDTLSLLFIGDSDIELWDTQGYGRSKNIGVGGATCPDVLHTLDETLASYSAERAVVVCGENDFPDRSAGDTAEIFRSITEKLQAAKTSVVYMGTKPEPETIDLHTQYQEYDELIKQMAIELATSSEAPPLVMIDVYHGFEALGNPNSLYAEDQLHLSEQGYSYWNQWLEQALGNERCIIWQSDTCFSQP